MDSLRLLQSDVKKLADPKKAKFFSSFFKTGKGQYGEGDLFLGLTVPQCRLVATKYKDLSLLDVEKLLMSKMHEERLIALIILIHKFQKGSKREQKLIYDFYLAHTKYINNWDLVDLSAYKIVGKYLYSSSEQSESRSPSTSSGLNSSRLRSNNNNTEILYKLAKSQNIWERRIAIVSTYQYITTKENGITFEIAEILLYDKHDLIQKAVGWMLREVGKRCSEKVLISFLAEHYKTMPRTTLRYAIERFPEKTRKAYLLGQI